MGHGGIEKSSRSHWNKRWCCCCIDDRSLARVRNLDCKIEIDGLSINYSSESQWIDALLCDSCSKTLNVALQIQDVLERNRCWRASSKRECCGSVAVWNLAHHKRAISWLSCHSRFDKHVGGRSRKGQRKNFASYGDLEVLCKPWNRRVVQELDYERVRVNSDVGRVAGCQSQRCESCVD